MDEDALIWDHFKFNAEQRLKAFNFFVVLSVFADGGVFAAYERDLAPGLVSLLGAFIVLFSIVFFMIDTRSKELIQLTIPALKEVESKFRESGRLFAIDAARQGAFIRYTVAFRILLGAQFLFGCGVLVEALLRLYCAHNGA